MPALIEVFPCRSDNIGVLIHDPATGATAAIDAPEADPILEVLAAKNWSLTDVLVTHKHADHVEGILPLKDRYDLRVTGPGAEAGDIPGLDVAVREGDRVRVGTLEAKVIATPGHTAGHIGYWFEKDEMLFAGDTLFALGCGRLFENSPEEMWQSLQKLAALPDATRLYCGHEYTQSNARFALTVTPDDPALQKRAAAIDAIRAAGKLTIPVTLGEEKATNPFLRANEPTLAKAVGLENGRAADVFAALRRWKDKF
ncbi:MULTISPECIES: hydroxyacylglutathione hydrolase [unclassified Chelatococcus]|uniref:hydroxyacylglutathione hydrolase n=1 Tax=unclassified Chelatococcus TaxID=2638111 RepID=UPI001BCA8A8F|nr:MULTISPECIES: hydroxyacylglutathione hydrolase [unclassified Chelatococcus]CAH1653694.1 Hydroxyacylglutathione hydrolase [Hyphomicrobiales bacterium]MBS7740151.1 hydroxyacylglutathione hydrolase [Chelatococcus sp. HY11]MBX3545020.1 hydroxyacylglutathione hydrolase [Chelatococcus sp.]MCO5079953.1 hydroxyacylglutathione hydrolase [Chelatococcus sp.]CAH1685632.1 Hydroxyacylglutathione hydrolase [Hyphomicrobiales bacterium]